MVTAGKGPGVPGLSVAAPVAAPVTAPVTTAFDRRASAEAEFAQAALAFAEVAQAEAAEAAVAAEERRAQAQEGDTSLVVVDANARYEGR